ncbi:MAG: amidophosphoribosyltransferase [Acidobacteria bacterium]|uniref:Amidophosphoribosyltransferase n=1 Tax=Candidatus Polarisedimenticola svalbardensis TaxID=2886004 RepID=A0A8J7CJU5_9BACT|nr:amidophosphoribosyltransferase [Candidatus Polarisedimenticola svalbardensis]
MCGIVGVFGHAEAAGLAYTGLFALQHRGQESAGVAAADGPKLACRTGMGLVSDVLGGKVLDALPGEAAIGQVRYSTTGDSNPANAQPFLITHHRGPIAVAHNGNLVNGAELRGELEESGAIFQTTTDTEALLHLVARSKAHDVVDAIVESLHQVQGAYSLLFMVPGRMVAVRDPYGFRPLCLGRLNGSWVVASETCALDLLGAQFVREMDRGEVLVVDVAGVHSHKPFKETRSAACVFEHVYFSRPDSTVFGKPVQQVRKRLGDKLFREQPVQADMVVPVPDSGVYAAMGYARAADLPFEMGLVRNHYVGRTFIQPTQEIRNDNVRVKLNPVRDILEGRRIILIDDSIVRGTTSRKIVRMCREAGASEVHLRISCPPTIGPCYYGIDTPRRNELIAANNSVDEIRDFVGADSLAYLSLAGMLEAMRTDEASACTACWTLEHPVAIPAVDAQQLRLFERTRK